MITDSETPELFVDCIKLDDEDKELDTEDEENWLSDVLELYDTILFFGFRLALG